MKLLYQATTEICSHHRNPLLPSPLLVDLSTPSLLHRLVSLTFPMQCSLFSSAGTTPSRPIGMPHSHTYALVDSKILGKCFANAVLQLLVHSPPLRNLFRELRDLKCKRREGDPLAEAGGSAKPLVDAMMRFQRNLCFRKRSRFRPSNATAAAIGRRRKTEGRWRREERSGCCGRYNPF